MAYNFNNSLMTGPDVDAGSDANTASSPTPAAAVPAPAAPAAPATDAESPVIPLAPVTSANPESAAGVRFRSCRWMQPPENGTQAFCTHREVKPYAGAQGFDAEAWCPECQYYKLRRAPRKRNEETFTY